MKITRTQSCTFIYSIQLKISWNQVIYDKFTVMCFFLALSYYSEQIEKKREYKNHNTAAAHSIV